MRHYVAHFLEGDPATVFIYEQYVDEAALDAHQNSAALPGVRVEGLYRKMRRSRSSIWNAIV